MVSFTTVLLLASLFPGADAELQQLLQKVPDGANTLIVVDVAKLHQSPMGMEQQWAQKHQSEFAGGATNFPPDSRYVVLASQLSQRNLGNYWEAGILSLNHAPSMAALAKQEKGTLEQIGGKDVVLTPRDTYLVQFSPKIAGFHYPAIRQQVSRWIRDTESSTESSLSDYLTAAASIAEDQGQIVVAMDLLDAIDPYELTARMSGFESLKSQKYDADAFAKLLTGARGITFAVRVTDEIIGKIQIDFDGSTMAFNKLLKPFLLEAAKNNGIYIDDFEDWKMSNEISTVVLQGKLSKEGLRKILSIIELPPASFVTSDSSSSPAPVDPHAQAAEASKNYFAAVNGLLDDLRKHQGKTQGENAVWHDRYAKKIDQLPILNVDPQLLDYGTQTAQVLRDIALSLRGIGIQTGVRQAQFYGNNSGSYYSYGPASYHRSTQSADNNRVRREEIAKGVTNRFDQWKAIDDATSAIRKVMVEKYKIEF